MTHMMTQPFTLSTIAVCDTRIARSIPMPECPSADVLSAFLHGTLNDLETETVASHVRECLVCDAMLSDSKADPLALAGQPSAVAADRALGAAGAGRAGTLGESIALLEADAHKQQRLGPYELLEKLGQGGMGAVYKARHTKLNRIEAIKILPPHLAKDANAKNRFEREIQAVGALNHPNIVQARHGDEAAGQLYLVMEFIDGRDLASLVKQHVRLPIADACEIIRQTALGLQHAYDHGLVHRDIKPSNLMLVVPPLGGSAASSPSDSRPPKGGTTNIKILDLGLARLDSTTEQLGELTSTGQIMGTLDYMAPEQGGDAHQVDIRADLYSLGATLYHLLTGQPPFPSPKYKTAAQKLQALTFNEPTPIRELRPEVPESLAAIVHRLLAKQPDARFAVPHEVASTIAPFTVGHNLAQLVATSGPLVAEPELASTFQHLSASQVRTDVGLVGQPFQADPNVERLSTSNDRSSQAGKPDLRAPRRTRAALGWVGAAARLTNWN